MAQMASKRTANQRDVVRNRNQASESKKKKGRLFRCNRYNISRAETIGLYKFGLILETDFGNSGRKRIFSEEVPFYL